MRRRLRETTLNHILCKSCFCLLLYLLLWPISVTSAQILRNHTIGTLVYDARLREFRCWSEGYLDEKFRESLCDAKKNWYPITANLYFVRGQSISVIIANATAGDIFSLDIKADDLAEPVVPISGVLSELPKLQPIPAAPTILAGVNASFVSGASPIKASAAYRLALIAEEKDFKAWVQTNLIDPFTSKEVTDLLAVDLDTAIQQATASDALIVAIKRITTDLDTIDDPKNMDQWIARVKLLVLLIDREAALRSRLLLTGVASAGATINNALTASRTSALQRAIAVDPGDFLVFANNLATVFDETPYARIAAITVTDRKFQSNEPKMAPLIDGLNSALGNVDATTALPKVKANLVIMVDNFASIQLAEARRETLENIRTALDEQKNSATGIYALQKVWTQNAEATVAKAALLNAAAKSLPLEYDIVPVGQWFGSKTISVTVKHGQRVGLFDIGGISDTTRAGLAGGDTPASKATQTAATDMTTARVLQFPVYNQYRLKLGLGFLYSTAEDKIFRVQNFTTGSGATAVNQKFVIQTRDRDYNVLATVNLMLFPWQRHAFPWRPRYASESRPHFYQDFGAMLGFSATSPNRDFLFGGAWFPRMSPVGVQFGWHLSLRDYPLPGSDISQPVNDRVIALKQTRANGFAAGMVFNTDFFGKVFAPIFKP